MADKVTFKVSSAAAAYLGADTPRQDKLKAAAGQVPLPPKDLVLLLYYLCHDADPEVKGTAVASLRSLPSPFLSQLLSDRELHPRILDVLLQLHFNKPELTPLFADHPMLSEKAACFLVRQGVLPCPTTAAGEPAAEAVSETPAQAAEEIDSAGGGQAEAGTGEPRQREERRHLAKDGLDDAAQGLEPFAEDGPALGPDRDDTPVDEKSQEFQSKYQMAQNMGVGEKIKAALTGDKEWRSILIKDSNKLVSVAVVRNPRISDGEVLAIAKSAVQNEEIMRVICANKEWVKSPLIRKALAENNKTPIPAALRFVATLCEKDLSALARSKNVATVVASQARRTLMAKRDGR